MEQWPTEGNGLDSTVCRITEYSLGQITLMQPGMFTFNVEQSWSAPWRMNKYIYSHAIYY